LRQIFPIIFFNIHFTKYAHPADYSTPDLLKSFGMPPPDSSFLKNAHAGDVFSWNEISEIHKVRNGIYQRGGVLISLLTDFGKINPCYPDFHGATTETIFYTGAGRRGDQKLDSFNSAMFNAVESTHVVPLFNKLKVGHWQFLGFWRVLEGKYLFDEDRQRMVWKFTLQRSIDHRQ
jgi:hypothetical protein